ncbi:MAG: tRNA(Ile)-lysidine synthetase [Clostridia bacterium]|jgi:tRNA(Ile)-lysidine synthase|nr:tRNA(Ile)-lysidine synthetase [Clostridia bacterium]
MCRAIENKVKNFIKEYNLIQSGDCLVVGVSGGADSMMLLHFLYTHQSYYDVQIKVAHVHHGMRAEAEGDALFVKQMCEAWNLSYYRHNCDIKELAKTYNVSEEEAGRTERYNFFISLSNNSSKIVTAHTMNDQAETLIMRFLRGTDIHGLGGIPPIRDTIIRPLLCLKRVEIEAYCKEYAIAYRDDHTNFMPIYTRNKIRLECIPYIEENINENVVSLLGGHSHLYREHEQFLKEYTKNLFEKCTVQTNQGLIISLKLFEKYHPYIQKRIILLGIQVLNKTIKDITLKHLESVLGLIKLQSGKKVSLPYRITAIRQYDEIIINYEGMEATGFRYDIKIGTIQIPELKSKLLLKIVPKQTINQKNEKMYTKYIDYGKIKDGLQIRTRLPQDYIMTAAGTKKLKKLLIDDKVPKILRDSLPLIADGNEIIWIVGSRLSTSYYITEHTEEVLEIQIMLE